MTTPARTIKGLMDLMQKDDSVKEEFKQDPEKAMQKFFEPTLPDTKVYRILIAGLVSVLLIIVIGVIIAWGWRDKNEGTIPTILTAIGSAAIGALAGILAPNPRQAAEQ
jgi:hypothetical protein